jgi:hypothetical protein
MWGVWRRALADFLPLLFKPAATSGQRPAPTALTGSEAGVR